ncbi:MAG: TIGR03759 family integrating conjugative element protein [Gammaproteobacteria bacterium CG11_big_fil_rev_8_21_14_0_20_46_22]|nr:MAG: TIGR03759 family integrating conjugative element protein [Gammaproteobacteria bacterium CG12_big_fil_rev_8_21_14_0_65_46_12]PIR11857.1 MAG: TIGR03759 family integrating conjugative element protein [Gammaproteobacteria bacterium CG11_big_fil_rev_8_21_14_0_20_46_22]
MNKQNDKPNETHRETVCNALQLFSGFLFWFLSFTAVPALADAAQVVNPHQTQNQIVQSLESQYSLKDRAKMWGLTTADFKRYLWLMKNTPSGHWYKKLDPAEVLALNAKDPDQMMRYAKVQARNMHARVTRELAFDRIYSKAYKALYPNEKPIMSKDLPAGQGANLQSGDRLWLFVSVNTPLGSFAYQHLIKAVQATPNTVLDIYFVGKNLSQKAIQQWAVSAGIPRDLVNKQVTLNYGESRFESLTKGKNVNLPFVGVIHNNHFQPISLSSVL